MLPLRCCLILIVVFVFGSGRLPLAAANQVPVDTLVICPAEFQEALDSWVEYRSRQGHSIRIISPARNAQAIKQQIRNVAMLNPLESVFLIGDSGQKGSLPGRIVPTDYVAAKVNVLFGSEPEIATDNTFADLDDDGIPDLAIGRLPADSIEEVERFSRRVIEYEKSAGMNQDWRRNINFVAGVGGFGSIVDSVIEKTTKQIITDLVPEDYRTSMTFGSWRSPYCPDPRRFSETAIRRFNEGCLFWVYIGHGRPHKLDRVYLPDQSHHIMDTRTVRNVHCENGSPIAIFLSCYSGAADHEHDCLAEAMIRQPRGPIAALCGTRVTMPYAMSLLSLELVNEYFDGDSMTLGDLTMVAKQRMVDHEEGQKNPYRMMIDGIGKVLSPRPGLLKQERLEHVQLIHLFGDPLLRINRPQKIELASQEIVRAGDALIVKGDSPLSGTITIELCYRRDRFRVRPPRRKTYDSSDESFRKYQEVYEQAHALTCFSESRFVAKGEFEHVIRVPEEAGGRCVVRCLLAADDGFASGSIPVEIRKPIPLREARR